MSNPFALPSVPADDVSQMVNKASGLYVALCELGLRAVAEQHITVALFDGLSPATLTRVGDALGFYIRNMDEKDKELPLATTMEQLLVSLALPIARKPGTVHARMVAPVRIESVGGAAVSYVSSDTSTCYEFHNGSKAFTTREGLVFRTEGNVPVRLHNYDCDARGNFKDAQQGSFSLSAVLALLLSRDIKTLPVVGAEPIIRYMAAAKLFLKSQFPVGTRTLPALEALHKATPMLPFPAALVSLRTQAMFSMLQIRADTAKPRVVPAFVDAAYKLSRVLRDGYEDAGKTPTGFLADTTASKQLSVFRYLETHHGLDATKAVYVLGSGDAHLSSIEIYDQAGRKYNVFEREIKLRPNAVAADALVNTEDYAGAYVISDMLFGSMEAAAFRTVTQYFPRVVVWKTLVSATSGLAKEVANLSPYYTKNASLTGGRGHNSENFICMATDYDLEVHKQIARSSGEVRLALLAGLARYEMAVSEAELLSLFAALHQAYTDRSLLRTMALLDLYTEDQLGDSWPAYAAARGGAPAKIRCMTFSRAVEGRFVVSPFDLSHVTSYRVTSGAAFSVPLEIDAAIYEISDATTNMLFGADDAHGMQATEERADPWVAVVGGRERLIREPYANSTANMPAELSELLPSRHVSTFAQLLASVAPEDDGTVYAMSLA